MIILAYKLRNLLFRRDLGYSIPGMSPFLSNPQKIIFLETPIQVTKITICSTKSLNQFFYEVMMLSDSVPSRSFEFEFACRGHEKTISSAKFSNDVSRVASVSGDKTCRIWSMKTHNLAQILVGHAGGLCDCAWSSDDKIIATASDDTSLMLWDSWTGKCIRLLAGHECSVTCCAFNLPSSNVLASGSLDETLRLWDIKNGKCILVIPAHADPISTICFSVDGTMILTGSYDGSCRFWDKHSGACLKSLSVSGDKVIPVSFLCCTPNPSYILLGTLSDSIMLIDIKSGRSLKKYISHKNREFCLPTCYMKIEEAELIMCGSENGQIYVWDSNSQQVLYTVPVKRAHEKSFKSVVAVTTGRNNNAIVSFFLNKIDHELKVWRYSEHK